MAKKRFDEIDVMRIIGFLMVVDQHILGAYAQRADTGFAGSLVLHFFLFAGKARSAYVCCHNRFYAALFQLRAL